MRTSNDAARVAASALIALLLMLCDRGAAARGAAFGRIDDTIQQWIKNAFLASPVLATMTRETQTSR
jgi:hypothetical protein